MLGTDTVLSDPRQNYGMITSNAARLLAVVIVIAPGLSAQNKKEDGLLVLPKVQATANVPLVKIAEYRMKEERFAPAAVISLRHIYIIGGQNSAGTILRSIERFDVESGESKVIASLAIGRLWAQAVLVENKIFVFGGQSLDSKISRSSVTSVGETLRGSAEQRAQNRIDGASWGSSSVSESKWQPVHPEETVEVIDLDTGEVSTAGQMPEPRSEFGCVFLNGLIYVIGGKFLAQKPKGDAFTNRVDIFDPVTRKWTAGPNLINPATANVAVVDDTYILIPGGFNGTKSLDSVVIFDPKIAKRGQLPSLCRPTSAHAAVCLDKYMFLFGDYQHPEEILAYNLRDKTSATFTLQYEAARHAAVVADAKKIFVIGGKPDRDSTPLNKIQVFQLTSKKEAR